MKYLALFSSLLTCSAFGQNLFPGPGSPLFLDTTRLFPTLQVNPITTNTPTGMTNVIQAIGGVAGLWESNSLSLFPADETGTLFLAATNNDASGTSAELKIGLLQDAFIFGNENSYGTNSNRLFILGDSNSDPEGTDNHTIIGSNNTITNAPVGLWILGDQNILAGTALAHSGIFGHDTLLVGALSYSIGEGNTVIGSGSYGIGTGHSIVGDAGFAFGDFDQISGTGGSDSYAFGFNNIITNGNVYLFGNSLVGIGANDFRVGTTESQPVKIQSSSNVFQFGTAGGFTIPGTTNQVIFGATNTAPASAVAPTKWISVQVQGENTKKYRIPLYE